MSLSAIQCPVCLGKAKVVFRSYPGYQEPAMFDIANCMNCNTSFALAEGVKLGPLYEAIYRKADVIPGYSRYSIYAREALSAQSPLEYLAEKEVTYWGIKKYLDSGSVSKNSATLEVGSGLGYLTFALNKSGRKAIGIDISTTAVDRARRLYGDSYTHADLADYAVDHAGQFDLVIATEVIEHLEGIYPFLMNCLKLLKPDGALLITTPNREAWAPDVIWQVEGPPVHLWWFSRKSFEAIASRISCFLSFVDLSGSPDATSWELGQVENSNPVAKLPVLDRFGDLVPRLRPRPMHRRILSRLRNITRKPLKLVKENRDKERIYSVAGPCPTLCVVLKRTASPGPAEFV